MLVTTISAFTAAALLWCGGAIGAEPDSADAFFRRGIALMESGAIPQACAAFEESERLESKAGTLLNLAGCYERASRWDEAYRTFERARDAARARQRSDWETIAGEHLTTLRPKVALVTLDAARVSDLPDARVTIDGRPLADDELRRGIAVSPGKHVIRGEATGYRASEQTVTTPPDANVKLLPLERERPSTDVDAAPGEAAPTGSPARKTVGLVVGATGAAALVFGAVGGILASGALSDAKSACSSYPDHCSPDASGPNDRAGTWSTLSTVGLASGAALVVAGVALYLWPTSSAARATRTTVTVTRTGGGLGLAF
jgi:hypothetical protein